jgi:UDP-N-acetylmuramoyl-L-alanyl-D-glutamate--2,6-diaminopimelate ligase
MTFTQLLALVQSGRLPVTADSRQVQAGGVFVAVTGTQVDGHDFTGEAKERGAAYIVAQRAVEGVECVLVDDSATALGLLAQASYGNPSSGLTNLAVTGTNGKTTVAYMVRSILEYTGKCCGLIGTVEYSTGANRTAAPLTTPDAVTIARAAREMVDNGCDYMMIEASSHALYQRRLAGISFTAAAFTNLTGDHLDYHKTEDEYLDAKSRLFRELPPHGMAVLNTESDAAHRIAEMIEPGRRTLLYGIECDADVVATIHRMDISGSVFDIEFNDMRQRVQTGLPGRHNISNCLAAAGLCLAAGVGLDDIAAGLSMLKTVPGRLQPVLSEAAKARNSQVFVDYAHTDDALKNVLTTLRPLCEGRLIVVFGCGGDRDKTKRPRMAQVAESLADVVIVTSDNPRTENPQAIIDDIMQGFTKKRGREPLIEAERAKAIRLAIEQAQGGDIVLIAGKGHENYQIIGTQRRHFSDVEEAMKAMEELM